MESSFEWLYNEYIKEKAENIRYKKLTATLRDKLDECIDRPASFGEAQEYLEDVIYQLETENEKLKAELESISKIAEIKSEKVKTTMQICGESSIKMAQTHKPANSIRLVLSNLYSLAVQVNNVCVISRVYNDKYIILSDNKGILNKILEKCGYGEGADKFIDELQSKGVLTFSKHQGNSAYANIPTNTILYSIYNIKKAIMIDIAKCRELKIMR